MNQDPSELLPEDFENLSKHAPALARLLEAAKAGSSHYGFVLPEQYFDELPELLKASTAFAAVDRKDGFLIPEAYFDLLPETIQAQLSFAGADRKDGFLVPENYFETLPAFLSGRISIEDLREGKSFVLPEDYFDTLGNLIQDRLFLESIKSAEGFKVPDDYFDDLSHHLHTAIALDNLRQDEGFEVPEGYFEKFPQDIQSRITVSELKEGSDSDVPDQYFDSLSSRIRSRIAGEEKAAPSAEEKGRVILFAEYVQRNARYIGLAAAVAVLVGVGIYMGRNAGTKNGDAPVIAHNDTKGQHKQPGLQPAPQPKDTNGIIAPQPHQQPNNIANNNPSHLLPDTAQGTDSLKNIATNDSLKQGQPVSPVIDAQADFTKALADADFRQAVIDYLAEDNEDIASLVEANSKQKGTGK